MKTRPKTDPQQTAECVYSIPCEFGRSYIGETGRPLAVRLREHRHNLKEGLFKEKASFVLASSVERQAFGLFFFVV
jgi:predicted GIY-YIG superfamily endonuclease